MSFQNIVIFGASGFVGQHLIRFLHAKYPEAKLFNIDIAEPKNERDAATWIKADVRKPIDGHLLPSSVDCIINLAAIHKSPGHPSPEYFETNILGARNICAYAERTNSKHIVFTSSIAVYGPGEDEKTEDSIPMPAIPYGISKIIAEFIHKEWLAKAGDRKLAIIRPAVIFGMGEKGNFTRIATALRKGIFVYPGRKSTIKSCVYVKDVCRLIDFMMNIDDFLAVYNCCYPEKITTEQICKAFNEVLGYKMPKAVVPQAAVNSAARVLRIIDTPFIRSLGLDPARISKLVNSTNISSELLVASGFFFEYDLKAAINDWSIDCEGKKLH